MPEGRTVRMREDVDLIVALAILVACWGVLALAPAYTWQTGDIRFYARWGGELARHLLPYRDFPLEYPPGSLPVFALPEFARRLFHYPTAYAYWFRLEVLLLWIPMIVVTAKALTRAAVPRVHRRLALVVCGAFPLILGPIAAARYDVFPALLTAFALAAMLSGRSRLACAFIAVGFVAKLYPIVLLPIALVVLWRKRGVRGALQGVGISLVVGLAGFGFFLLRTPQGLWAGIWRQLSRPLQVESGAASLWALAHVVAGTPVHPVTSYGSDNIVTHGADLAASLSGLLVAAALVTVWVRFARRSPTRDQIAVAAAASVTGYLAFSKVFSPQYLIWLVPLVLVLRGPVGQRAMVLLVAITALTQTWEPFLYSQLLEYHTLECLLLVVRNLLVVGLFGVLVAAQEAVAEPVRDSTPAWTVEALVRRSRRPLILPWARSES